MILGTYLGTHLASWCNYQLGILKGKQIFKCAKVQSLPLLHSGFFSQFLFRFETSSVLFMSRKTDILQGPIDDLTSKLIFFFAFFAIIDQF